MRNVFLFIRRHFNFLFFLVLQIVSLSFLFRYNKFHEAAFMNVSTELTGRINEKYNGIEYYFQLKRTNESLVKENIRLRQLLKENYEAPDSNRRLVMDTIRVDSARSILKYNYLEAKVVGNTTALQFNYLTIHRGFAQQVRPNMGVVGPQGIVGTVVNVSENYATVMSLLHRQYKVVVKLKNGAERGAIEWDGLSPLFVTLKDIPKSAKVAKGDTVLTSQTSSLFPANIMVGTVYDIVPDNASNFYTLKVRPATNFFNIEYVYVIDNMQFEEQKRIEDSTRKKVQ
ncbi:rod shape-determining protein MreC [Flavitalea sp. BT771]|uniref:rod shape-determining protein MreC n=1 Tax=Flavitalea sp. BT771 TaxID=3063329 RepID=UPI0026E16566|nr:rod shape-determining protein MreC [Flavitalea sp. BT771]MDO6434054.1 rod shape-determining protein MreC [Flavitalea sp. BT771]MDV6222954.1 rod shape-determining protein MreC [Flavitalea sp. BT771]